MKRWQRRCAARSGTSGCAREIVELLVPIGVREPDCALARRATRWGADVTRLRPL